MTIQNGVENEEALCTVLPRESVMGGNARVGAELTAPGKLLHTASGIIEFGELDGRETPRAQRMAEAFKRAGVFGQLTRDLKSVRWKKLMGNNGTNTVSALARCTLGEMFADPEGDALVHRLITETAIAARAEGAQHLRRGHRDALQRRPRLLQRERDQDFDAAGPRARQAPGIRRDKRRRGARRAPPRAQRAGHRDRARAAEAARRASRLVTRDARRGRLRPSASRTAWGRTASATTLCRAARDADARPSPRILSAPPGVFRARRTSA